MSTHTDNGIVAEIESRTEAWVRSAGVSTEPAEGEVLNRTFRAEASAGGAHLEAEVKMLPILQLVRNQLSTVIDRGKAALMMPEHIGLGQPGFNSVSIADLTKVVDSTMHRCERMVFEPELALNDRLVAAAFTACLEKFQYNLFGLEVDGLGRTHMRELLPALQEFKQICMELELKLSLKQAAPSALKDSA